MKVCLINNAWPMTGLGRIAFEMLSQFKEMDKDVDMVYLQSRVPLKTRNNRIKILKNPLNPPIGSAAFNNYFYFPHKIPKGYDIYNILNHTIARCCINLKNSIVTCADIFPYVVKGSYDNFTEIFIKKHLEAMKEADRIISISEYTKMDIVEHLNVPEDEITVVYEGVNHRLFKPDNKNRARKKLGLPIDQKIILNVGTAEPRKNIPTLIRVLDLLREDTPDIKLIRIGKTNVEIDKMIEKLGLKENIKYFSGISNEKLVTIYNAADAFVFPSYYEGSGTTALEAMACGLPVISSNATANPEAVGNAGIMLDPFDVEGFSNAIYKVLNSKKLSEKMSKKSLKQSQKFTWRKCAEETWNVYENLLGVRT